MKELNEKLRNEMIPLTLKWSNERGMFQESNRFAQWCRGIEEKGEIFKAYNRDDRAGMLDAIGDTLVTYINVMEFKGEEIAKILDFSLEFLRLESCLYDVETMYDSDDYPTHLNKLANLYDSDLYECFMIAYNVIKDRKGKFINGSYVKESDLVKMGIEL